MGSDSLGLLSLQFLHKKISGKISEKSLLTPPDPYYNFVNLLSSDINLIYLETREGRAPETMNSPDKYDVSFCRRPNQRKMAKNAIFHDSSQLFPIRVLKLDVKRKYKAQRACLYGFHNQIHHNWRVIRL